jgi:hypothetical protein
MLIHLEIMQCGSPQLAFSRTTAALDSSDHRSSSDYGSRSVNRTVRGGRGNVAAEVTYSTSNHHRILEQQFLIAKVSYLTVCDDTLSSSCTATYIVVESDDDDSNNVL